MVATGFGKVAAGVGVAAVGLFARVRRKHLVEDPLTPLGLDLSSSQDHLAHGDHAGAPSFPSTSDSPGLIHAWRASHATACALLLFAVVVTLVRGAYDLACILLAALALLTFGRAQDPHPQLLIAPKLDKPALGVPQAVAIGVELAAVEGNAAPVADPGLTGVWIKDNDLSDSMGPACDAMRLNGFVRLAVRLVKGMELRVTPTHVDMDVLSVVSGFRIRERYPFNGEQAQYNRRDLRRGKHVGRVQVLPSGHILVHLSWPEPMGGTGQDSFSLAGPDVLHVASQLWLGEEKQHVTYRAVYHRKR